MLMFGAEMNKIKKAQSTLELTLSWVVLVILLAGMIKVVSWSSRCIVGRHNAYLYHYKGNYNNPSEFYTPPNADFVPQVGGIDN